MEVLSEDEDSELKEELKERYSIHTSWGAGRADVPERLTFYWPYDSEEQMDRVRRTAEFVDTPEFDQLYLVAFKREQYHTWEETFEEKYSSRSARIKTEGLPEFTKTWSSL